MPFLNLTLAETFNKCYIGILLHLIWEVAHSLDKFVIFNIGLGWKKRVVIYFLFSSLNKVISIYFPKGYVLSLLERMCYVMKDLMLWRKRVHFVDYFL